MLKGRRGFRMGFAVFLTAVIISCTATYIPVMANELELSVDEALEEKQVTVESVQEDSIADTGFDIEGETVDQDNTDELIALNAAVDYDGERVSDVRLQESGNSRKLLLSYKYKAGYVYTVYVIGANQDEEFGCKEIICCYDESICPEDENGDHIPTTSSGESSIDITGEIIGWSDDVYVYAYVKATEPENAGNIRDYSSGKISERSNIYHYQKPISKQRYSQLYLEDVKFNASTGVLSWTSPYDTSVYETSIKEVVGSGGSYSTRDIVTIKSSNEFEYSVNLGEQNSRYEGESFSDSIIQIDIASDDLTMASSTEWYMFGIDSHDVEKKTLSLREDGCVYLSKQIWDDHLTAIYNKYCKVALYKINDDGTVRQISLKTVSPSACHWDGGSDVIVANFAWEIQAASLGQYYAVLMSRIDELAYKTPVHKFESGSVRYISGEPEIETVDSSGIVKIKWEPLENTIGYYCAVYRGNKMIIGKYIYGNELEYINIEPKSDITSLKVLVIAFPREINNYYVPETWKDINISAEEAEQDIAYIDRFGVFHGNIENINAGNDESDHEMGGDLSLYCTAGGITRRINVNGEDQDLYIEGSRVTCDLSKYISSNGSGKYYATFAAGIINDDGALEHDGIYKTQELNYTEPQTKLPINIGWKSEDGIKQIAWPADERINECYWETSGGVNVFRAIPKDITLYAPSDFLALTDIHTGGVKIAYKKTIYTEEDNNIIVSPGDKIALRFYADSDPAKHFYTPKELTDCYITQDWRSDDSKIATVSDGGVITAVSPGTTTVAVELTDIGEGWHECYVNVKVEDIPVTSLKLNETAIELSTKGEPVTLTATPTPVNATGFTLNWESSAPSIASVSNGIVTPVSGGEATITVKALDSTGKELAKAQCEVTVTEETIAVSGVTLNKSQLDMQEGDTEELTAVVEPATATNKIISWNSSNTQAASVDQNGKVTAGVPGTAIITVTTEDGEKTATCTVTVKNKVILKGVQLNETSITLSTKGDPVTLTATPYPEDVRDVTYEWTSSDPGIVTVKDGVLTPVAEGSAKVSVIAKDALNNSAKAIVEVTVTDGTIKVTGVSLNESSLKLKIGDSVKLKAVIEPAGASNQKATWASDNSKAAIVDNEGLVTGVASGTAIITVTTEDGNKTAVCRVIVSESGSGGDGSGRDPGLNTSGETIDDGVHYYDAYMVKGQTYVFPAKYGDIDASSSKKDQDIAWKTSDKKIASVSGKTKVKAANSTGSTSTVQIYDGATSASSEYVYRLHIVDPMIVEYGKTTLLKSITLTAGDDCTLAVAGLTGYEDKFNVTWLSSNNEIAPVDNGIVSAVMKGSAKITAYVGGKAYNCTVKVENTRTIPKKIEDESTITLSPLQTVSLKFSSTLFKAKNLEWISADGTLKPYNKNNTVATSTDKVSYFQNEVIRVTPAGKVTAVGVGSTTISATDQNGITQTVTITVPQPVSQTLSLNVNKTKQIKLYNVNAGKATWSSSDSRITGNIVKGKIQGVRYGTAEATCTYDPYNTGKPFEYKITIYVENPKLDTKDSTKWSKVNTANTSGTLTLKVGDTYNVSLTDVYQDVVFTSNKPTVAFVDESGNISVRDAGKAKLTAKVNGTSITINIVSTK